jgi:hypothetical protein
MLNPFTEVNWNPGLAEKRKFAMSLIIGFPAVAVVFLLIGWLVKHQWKPFFMWLGVVGLAVGILLWLLPAIAKPFYRVWYFAGCCVGIVMGNLLLSVFYYLVLTPLGLLLRAAGHRPVTKGFDKSRPTYWRDARKELDASRYFRQF